MKIYRVRYDLDWGTRGIRRIHNFHFSKKPTMKQAIKKLADHYLMDEEEIRQQGVEIQTISLDEMSNYPSQSTHGI